LAAKLAGHSLPVFRHTSAKIITLLSSRKSELDEVVETVLQDQAFTTRILHIANSAYYRRGTEEIASIRRAILNIGYATTRDIAIASDYAEFAHKNKAMSAALRRLMSKAFVAAHQAAALGDAVRIPDSETLFTSALLESLGEIATASYFPEVTQEIHHLVQGNRASHDAAHHMITGMTPHGVTCAVAAAYHIPKELILDPPDWEDAKGWTSKDRRCAAAHMGNAYAHNLFTAESTTVLGLFDNLMECAVTRLELTEERVMALLSTSFQKALEFGAGLKLERGFFSLEPSSFKGTARARLIEACTPFSTAC
jgi:hypothetical protein